MNQANCEDCGEISPVCYCDEPTCLECDEYITGFALEHKQKVCDNCQEILDGN